MPLLLEATVAGLAASGCLPAATAQSKAGSDQDQPHPTFSKRNVSLFGNHICDRPREMSFPGTADGHYCPPLRLNYWCSWSKQALPCLSRPAAASPMGKAPMFLPISVPIPNFFKFHCAWRIASCNESQTCRKAGLESWLSSHCP